MTTFSFVSGVIEQRRPHMATWRATTDHGANPHMVPMVISVFPTLSNFGRTWTVGDCSAAIASLLTLPAGWRYLRFQSQAQLLSNADDRCDGSGEISVSPKYLGTGASSGKWFKGGAGGDALDSGYSGFRLTNAISTALAWATTTAALIAAGGATVDHLAFDSEVNPDEFNLNAAWKTALQADSYWSTAKAALDALVDADPATTNTAFSVADWTSQTYAINAWHSWYKGRIALVCNAILQGFRTQFPNCSASDDGYHGRSAVIAAAAAAGQASGINGQKYYEDSGIVGDYASEECYGEMGQVDATIVNNRVRYVLYGHLKPFETLRWELSRLMASVQSGRTLKQWVNFFGASRSDFQLGGYGTAAGADPCPYMVAHLAASLLMSAVSVFVSTGYSAAFAEAYYSDTITDGNLTLANGGIDQLNKRFWDNGDRTADYFRAGQTKSFTISGSTGNDGTYTIDYSAGGIWYDSGADRTYLAVNEAIPSATSDGTIIADATDAMDTVAEAVLAELAAIIGTRGPRKVLQRTVHYDEVDTADAEILPIGNPITWVGLRHGPQVTYCICIGRTTADKAAWTAKAITGYKNGVSQGTVATVLATKAYVYFTASYAYGDVWTFTWSQGAATNLLPSVDPTDTGNWTQQLGAGGISLDAAKLSPINGDGTYLLTRSDATIPFPVLAGKIYTVSCYVWVGDAVDPYARSIALAKGSDSSSIAAMNTGNRPAGDNRWERYQLTAVAPHGETTLKFTIGLFNGSYRSWYCHPQAVEGFTPGPIA